MSDLIGFVYSDVEKTPELARALDTFITEQYGENAAVAGHLAIHEDRQVLDIRVYMAFTPGPTTGVNASPDDGDTNPHGDGREAWDDLIEWMEGLDAHHTMTFFRRPHNTGSQPGRADTFLFDSCSHLCPQHNLVYDGHLVTDGRSQALILEGPPDGLDLDSLRAMLSNLPRPLVADIGRQLLGDHINSLDPDIRRAVETALDGLENDRTPTPEEKAELDAAVKKMTSNLNAPRRTSKDPFALPDIDERPDVPPAFYKN